MNLGRRYAAASLVALSTCLAGSPVSAEDDVAATLRALRPMMGAQPAGVRVRLDALRRQADAAGRLDWRLAVDEADCRLLTDLDETQAETVAAAGIAQVRGTPAGAATLPWLRLRACHAGLLLAAGKIAEGEAEAAAIIEASPTDALAPARGMALLERGLARSRRGQFIEGQEDLLAACALLRDASPTDLDLCHGHLANHYKRVGEYDEALALLEPLAQRAASAGATFDAAIHEYNLGQLQSDRHDWTASLPHYERALALSRSARDDTGVAYALHGMAGSLLHLGQPAAAQRHNDEALTLLTTTVHDSGQLLLARVTRAQILAELGEHRRAGQMLDAAEPEVKASGSDMLLSDFLRARIEVLSGQGAWREAFTAHKSLDEIEQRLQDQRQSRRSALLRAQYNRERDTQELRALKAAQQSEATLRTAQAAVIALTLVLLAVTAAYAWRKWHDARAMQTLALVDELTGISNRRSILGHAEAVFADAARHDRPLAVLMVDVDHFKAVNDIHGHDAGDEVLRALAARIQRDLRQLDRLGRLGGEEFLVVLPGTTPEHAVAVAERIRSAVAEAPIEMSAGPLRCTVSIGVAHRAAGDATASQLLARADDALYRAKAAGRDRVMADA